MQKELEGYRTLQRTDNSKVIAQQAERIAEAEAALSKIVNARVPVNTNYLVLYTETIIIARQALAKGKD